MPVLAADGSPLDRLRERSAGVRWQQHRHQWLIPPASNSEGTAPKVDIRTDSESPHVPDAPTEQGVEAETIDVAPPAPNAVTANRDFVAPNLDAEIPQLLPEPDRQRPTHHPDVLPLPDFLDGAGPLWLAPRLQAAVRPDQHTRTAGLAGSQLMVAQNEAEQPMAPRERGMLRPITEISPFLDYAPDGGDPCEDLCPPPSLLCGDDPGYLCPDEEPLPDTGPADRYFAHMNYFWSASNVYYNPLYFEDPLLERYGHVRCHEAAQPFFSMARFGGQLIGLPYQVALHHVHDRVYPLGYYRPGDPAPKLIYQPPLNARAGAVAAGIYTGLFFLVP